MSHPLCSAILEEVLATLDIFGCLPRVHAVRVLAGKPEKAHVIQIVVEENYSHLLDPLIPALERVKLIYDGLQLPLTWEFVSEPIARVSQAEQGPPRPDGGVLGALAATTGTPAGAVPFLQSGMMAKCGANSTFPGTLGFICVLNDKLVCTSNAHVFCGRGNSTKLDFNPVIEIGTNQDGFRAAARLMYFERMGLACKGHEAERDFAVAVFDEDVAPSVRPEFVPYNAQGNRVEYPVNGFTKEADMSYSDTFYRVGAMSNDGKPVAYIGAESAKVTYEEPFNGCVHFKKLALFDVSTVGGDSGSLMVHERTKSAVGLVLGIDVDKPRTCVMPFWTLPWIQQGPVAKYGQTYMSYTSDEVKSPMPKAIIETCSGCEPPVGSAFSTAISAANLLWKATTLTAITVKSIPGLSPEAVQKMSGSS